MFSPDYHNYTTTYNSLLFSSLISFVRFSSFILSISLPLMLSLKASTLNSLALHCGYPTASTKAARLLAIASYDAFFSALSPRRIVSVDVGIKNFSYCKLSYVGESVTITDWNHLNLHEKYGSGYLHKTGDSSSLVDSKAYLAHVAVNVVDNILMSQEDPDIITIENQRTRSNGKTSTLPNVLLNFTLENMIYAACEARGASHRNISIIPMNASKMVNFWMSRFLAKGPKITSLQSKTLRTQLLFGWLADPECAPFELKGLHSLPSDFASLSFRMQTSALLDLLTFDSRPKKVDDLVDCLLYNLMCMLQLRHHHELKKAQENEHDIAQLVHNWDKKHCRYLHPLLESTHLELASEYQQSL